MTNDAIILELLRRIQVLENEVEILKKQLLSPKPEIEPAKKPRITTTPEMIKACYLYGEQAYKSPKADIKKFVSNVVKETGMNKDSAAMYIYAVKYMLEGVAFKRAINLEANRTYFDTIRDKYGKNGLKKAIKSTREHITYRQGFNHNVDSIIKLCDEYEQFL